MERKEPSENARKALEVIRIGESGMVHWGPLDQYMKLFGVDEDTADEMLDDIEREMEQKGYWEDISGSMYDIDVLNDYEDEQARLDKEHQQYLDDIAAEWNRAKGIH